MSAPHGTLYYGDNLEVLRRHIPDESVDLIYLDPPFNSNRSYNVLFGRTHAAGASAQIEAFDDTWTWTHETEQIYTQMQQGGAPAKVADALRAMRDLVGDGAVLAYLVMMAVRLVELHRVLRPTGSMYLHCDPTASHYLKLLMDAIFGPRLFANEIVWKRTTAHNDSRRFGRVGDRILFYTKERAKTFNVIGGEYSEAQLSRYKYEDERGRYRAENLTAPKFSPTRTFEWRGTHPGTNRQWRFSREVLEELYAEGRVLLRRDGCPRKDGLKEYLDEATGAPLQDIWTDIAMAPNAAERLGYPTQKPVALLERILTASSNAGDVVLDPFCGCGTTVAAAHALGRRWIGIDVTYIAVDLIRNRLKDTYGDKVTFDVFGIPRDMEGAVALFSHSKLDFERWAVSLVQGQANQKQVGDHGIDGVIRFPLDNRSGIGRCVVSVKGGQRLAPAMVRDLSGTVETEEAEMGLLITMAPPTKGMVEAANRGGSYIWPSNERAYPRLQLISVEQLLRGEQPDMPPPFTPYMRAKRSKAAPPAQMKLGGPE